VCSGSSFHVVVCFVFLRTGCYDRYEYSIIHGFTLLYIPVRFWDSHTKLCLLRVPRDDARRIRASLAFLSTMQLKASSFLIVLSTRSMHGSARTAKRALLLAIRTQYQSIVRDIQRGAGDDKQLYPISQQWQATMETVLHTIDY
jgi:hypothetical protein